MTLRVSAFLCLLLCLLQSGMAEEVLFRARCTKVEPLQPVRIHWRWGGEGLGGRVVSGELTEFLPDPDKSGKPVSEGNRIIVEGRTFNHEYLQPGTWSGWYPVSIFKTQGRRHFVTFTLEGHKSSRNLTETELELEFKYRDKLLKRFTVSGPDGPTFGTVIPLQHLNEKGHPADGFVEELGSLYHYAHTKLATLSKAPWAKLPAPKLYGVVTDCAGYQPGSGYACRTTDKATMLAEFEVLRLLGVNGTRSLPDFVLEDIRKGEGMGPDFSRVHITHTIGYPIPMVKRSDGKAPRRSPGDGCPNHPDNLKAIQQQVVEAVENLKKDMGSMPVHEIWALTVDEIGSAFDGAPEGKAHMGACEHCRKDFREFVQKEGRTLEEFGAPDWSHIRPIYGYWTKSFWDQMKELESEVAKAKKQMNSAINNSFDLDTPEGDEPDLILRELEDLKPKPKGTAKPGNASNAVIQAESRLKDFIWNGKASEVPEAEQKHQLTETGWNLLHYYSRKYNAETSAQLFSQLKDSLDELNQKESRSLPPIYSYALRGNTFLMGGHSLGFFDFYKHADNGFVYETSNRDPRVWQWDSYLCDVGRSLVRFRDKRFAVYVKPHRGAPVQRALTAVARGAKMIYWYTYGPEWKKGDSFGGQLETLEKIGWVNRLIAQAEDVIYDSEWAVPAQVAIVRPRTAEFLSGPESWENGKWVHTALMHAHIPVDALDEDLLMELDLKPYKSIVVCGDHIRRDVAEKLKQWVHDGGHLVTYCNGMSRDEANLPLKSLWQVFGLEKRVDAAIWGKVSKYGATRLKEVETIQPIPEGASLLAQSSIGNKTVHSLTVGREVLFPVKSISPSFPFKDGGSAYVHNQYGNGSAEILGCYAGLESMAGFLPLEPYQRVPLSLPVLPVLKSKAEPLLLVNEPMVESVWLRNPDTAKEAIVLINWKFDCPDGVEITLPGSLKFHSVRSLALGTTIDFQKRGNQIHLKLPNLAEGDILLLDQ